MGYDCTLHLIDERAIRQTFVPCLLGHHTDPTPRVNIAGAGRAGVAARPAHLFALLAGLCALGCGPQAHQPGRGTSAAAPPVRPAQPTAAGGPAPRAPIASTVPATWPASEHDDLASTVLRHMTDKYFAREAPPPLTRAIQDLHRRDPEFLAKVMAAAEDPTRDAHERGRLLASLGLLGADAAPVARRLAEISVKDNADPAWPSPARTGASVALQGIGPAAAAALADVARTGTPTQARWARALLPHVGRAGGAEARVLLDRVGKAEDAGEFLALLDGARRLDPASLRKRDARAAGGRVLAIARGSEPVADIQLRVTAARLLPALGVEAQRAVPIIVRLAASLRDAEGAGWAALALAGPLREYAQDGQANVLRDLTGDTDASVREAALTFLAVPGAGPPDAPSILARALRSDSEPRVRLAAATALRAMGPAATAAAGDLESAARTDPSEAVRQAARAATKPHNR